MKVGFLCAEYPTLVPAHGGIGSSVQTLAHCLAEAGHEASVFCLADTDGEFQDGPVHGTKIRRGGTLRSAYRMRRMLRARLSHGELDVVESAETEAHMLPGGSGSVVRMNGSHHFWCAHLEQPRRYVRLFLEQLGIRPAAGLCAVSHFAAEETRRVMRLGRRTIDILPNPIDTDLFSPSPSEVVPGRVVFAGTITEKKGIAELSKVVDALSERMQDLHLIALGRDTEGLNGTSFARSIRDKLSSAGRERIEFRGPVDRPEVARWMRSAQICAFPSYMETQGIVVGEALASGRPAIASRFGPGPETLGRPPAGWLVDPRSTESITAALMEALENPELCNLKGSKGRVFVEREYGDRALLERTVEFYSRHARRV